MPSLSLLEQFRNPSDPSSWHELLMGEAMKWFVDSVRRAEVKHADLADS